jgi:hypothetical protein
VEGRHHELEPDLAREAASSMMLCFSSPFFSFSRLLGARRAVRWQAPYSQRSGAGGARAAGAAVEAQRAVQVSRGFYLFFSIFFTNFFHLFFSLCWMQKFFIRTFLSFLDAKIFIQAFLF